MKAPEDQIIAAKALVRHLVDRCLTVPDWAYWCGYGTKSFDLLCEAAAALFEMSPTDIEQRLCTDTTFGDREPRHVELEYERDDLRQRVLVLERKVRALGGEP